MNWIDKYFLLLENIMAEDWQKKVDEDWTIKDVIAHLVGWEEECAKSFPVIWKTKQKPWFIISEEGDDEFNQKSVTKYNSFSPKQLLSEWQMCYKLSEEEIDKIGEDNIKANPELFGWWYDLSHYETHYKQLQELLKK